ncbi:AGAP009527-PA-like protein [Anopheles sinensis]|uniref:AGAP009527-PA-like protein n=1 Tax=Anopheles sinensis TaxID=74873 RepID=A0A084VPC8_ANOSI|nr:AGAP009527-PA-like protein [Anopheles sinensis]
MRSLHVAILVVAVLALLGPVQSQRRHNGMCACPRIYMPVCGSDLKTYSNRCELNCSVDSPRGRASNLRLLREGSCEDKQEIVEMPEEIAD